MLLRLKGAPHCLVFLTALLAFSARAVYQYKSNIKISKMGKQLCQPLNENVLKCAISPD
jgi:hypothetical protein